MKKVLCYISIGPSTNFQERKVYGDDIAEELEKRPPLFPKPAQPDYSCRQCGALSFAPVDICDECLKPDTEPPPLNYACRQCGAFAFIPIEFCDDCLKIEKRRKRKSKKPARKNQPSKPPETAFKKPEKPKYEKLTIKEVERKKIDLGRAQRQCMKFRFGPDSEPAADRKKRLANLETLQTEYLYLFELIGYNIDLYLDSPKPNIYKSGTSIVTENER